MIRVIHDSFFAISSRFRTGAVESHSTDTFEKVKRKKAQGTIQISLINQTELCNF